MRAENSNVSPNREALLGRVPRFLKIIGIVLIAFVCVSVAHLIWVWPFTQARVTESIESTFPVKVTYTKFRATYFLHPGCVAEGVQFHWLANKADEPPVVSAAEFRIEAHYLELIFRPGYLAHIVLQGFRIDVPVIGTPRQPYTWHETPTHIRVGEINADGAVLQIARQDDAKPLIFEIQTARLTSASRNEPVSYSLRLFNPLPPGEITAHGKFGPWNPDDHGATQLSGKYSFKQADLSVFKGISGMLSSEDEFAGPLQRIETRGSVDIPDFSVTRSHHALHLKTNFHAFVNGLNGDVHLEHVDGGFMRTGVTGSGDIAGTPGGDGKTARFDLFVTNGRMQDLLRMFVNERQPPLNGVTSFRARVVWPPGKGSFLEKIRLTGDFGVGGSQFTKDATQSEVAVFSDRARGEKVEDDPPNKDDVVANLSGHVELVHAVANFNELSFDVPGASANMHGTFNLQSHAVDLHGTLKTEAEFSNMTTGFKSWLLKPFNGIFKKKHAGAVVPAHLIGTYEHPEPGLDIPVKNEQSKPAVADP